MELSTAGAILSFALGAQEKALTFYKWVQSVESFSEWSDVLETVVSEHKRAERRLARLRRESVTEMILEPIHGFQSEQFEIQLEPTPTIDNQSCLALMKRLEATLSDFFRVAATKTMFLQEISLALESMATKTDGNLRLLEKLG
ncbi:MAG: hypothetical protein ACFE8Z_04185 [Candidatus Hermodarchaeota archaeon]